MSSSEKRNLQQHSVPFRITDILAPNLQTAVKMPAHPRGSPSEKSDDVSSPEPDSKPQSPEPATWQLPDLDTDALHATLAKNDFNGKKKSRTKFTTEQLNRLESIFIDNVYLKPAERIRIANELQLSDSQLKTWFQNRRMKVKRKIKESTPQSGFRPIYQPYPSPKYWRLDKSSSPSLTPPEPPVTYEGYSYPRAVYENFPGEKSQCSCEQCVFLKHSKPYPTERQSENPPPMLRLPDYRRASIHYTPYNRQSPSRIIKLRQAVTYPEKEIGQSAPSVQGQDRKIPEWYSSPPQLIPSPTIVQRVAHASQNKGQPINPVNVTIKHEPTEEDETSKCGATSSSKSARKRSSTSSTNEEDKDVLHSPSQPPPLAPIRYVPPPLTSTRHSLWKYYHNYDRNDESYTSQQKWNYNGKYFCSEDNKEVPNDNLKM